MVAIVADIQGFVVGGQCIFKQVQWLFGNDKGVVFGSACIGSFVSNQTVSVGGYKLNAFRGKLKEYACHGWPQVVATNSKQCFVDCGKEGDARHGKTGSIIGCWLFGKIVGVFSHHFILTIIAGNFNGKVFIDIESERLIGDIF